MKKILLNITLILLFCTQALAESSVWKVEKSNYLFYLGGTCHLLRQSDFPLPPEFDKAYKASELLVFEVDPGELNDVSTQQKLMSKAMYADGSTIDQHLSPQTYQLLIEYCAANGIPLELLKSFKPSIIAVMLEVIELTKLDATQDGVDLFFYSSAKRDGKSIEGFETVEEQIDFIAGMSEGYEDVFVAHTLKELKSIKPMYTSLVDAWKRGDTSKMNDLMIADLKKTPGLYKKLVTDRNRNWLPIIDAYSKTPRVEFILVGAGHLVGPDGIIQALKKRGYIVKKLQAG